MFSCGCAASLLCITECGARLRRDAGQCLCAVRLLCKKMLALGPQAMRGAKVLALRFALRHAAKPVALAGIGLLTQMASIGLRLTFIRFRSMGIALRMRERACGSREARLPHGRERAPTRRQGRCKRLAVGWSLAVAVDVALMCAKRRHAVVQAFAPKGRGRAGLASIARRAARGERRPHRRRHRGPARIRRAQ